METGNKPFRLPIHNTAESPRLVIPGKPMGEVVIVRAINLDAIPHPLKTLPKSNGRPYVFFDIRETSSLPSTTEEKKPTINIFVVRFTNPEDPLENERQFTRGHLRILQYEKLIKLITDSEEKLQRGETPTYTHWHREDGIMQSELFKITPELLDELKHIAASFYADELVKEPFTQELAKGVKAEMVLQEEAVVSEAEQIIFEGQRARFSNIEVKHTEITTQSNQPTNPEPDNKKSTEELVETPTDNEASDQKTNEEIATEEKPVWKEVEEFLKLDQPSQEAAEFFRKLFSRPF